MMGLLNQLADKVMSSLGAHKQDPVAQGDLMGSITGLIDSVGGFPALLQKLKEGGLTDQVTSWIGEGENQAVSGDQIKAALGEENIGQVAQEAGIDTEQAATGLAQLLPHVISQLTQGGQIPQGALLEQGLNLLKGKLPN
ncbi:MAG: hypothetical protein ACI83P_001301 [Janthinobacterium sp.]|jgi:uncharacterized protein YidB (DUF937 family)